MIKNSSLHHSSRASSSTSSSENSGSNDSSNSARKALIERLGETDQLFLTAPSPALAQERALLRQHLCWHSVQKTEQLYLLGEAAVLLETSLTEIEQADLHAQMSGQLAAVYLQFYQLTAEQKYLTIVGQILKPLSNRDEPSVLLGLARRDAAQQKPALVQHWLSKLLALPQVTWADVCDVPEFAAFAQTAWFLALAKQAQAATTPH